ncbi:hypothetical protein FS837_002439, partial [Tulasnella sp. UAMH 9824]
MEAWASASVTSGRLARPSRESSEAQGTGTRKKAIHQKPLSLDASEAERAQSLAASPLKPASSFSRSAPRSTVGPETPSHFKVPDLPTKVIRPQRRSSSLQEAPVYDFTDEERRSTSPRPEPRQTGSPIPVYDFTDEEVPNGEASQHQEGVEFQLPGRLSTGGGPSTSQFTEMVEDEPEPIRAAQEESQEAQRPQRSRTRTQPRDAVGKFAKPLTNRKTKVGGRVTPIVKRKPGRPRLDGGKSIAVVQDGTDSAVRTRGPKRGAKRASRRPPTDSEPDVGDDGSEDDDHSRGPTTRFRMPPAPLPVSRGPPGQVPQDVMAAYASHSALLQSRTDTDLPQLYAAFQTFWIPRRANYFVLMGGAGSGLPYSAITSQGGGPGSSTAVHLSNPSFFFWDPLPLVPGGIRCPASECSNLLQQAGLVKQPKRVYMEGNTAVSNDPYIGFWIVAARYKCQNCGVRGTANPKVYSTYVAWDLKILERLPPLVRAEFPAVERKKGGRKAFFAAEIALPAEHRMDPQFVSTMLPTQPQPPVQNPASSAVPEPNGPSELPVDPGPSHSTAPDVASIGQVDNPGSSLPQAPSPQHVPARAQPPASWSREAEELGDAAGQLFAELLFGGASEPAAADGESGETSAQAVAGTSQTIDPGDGPNGASGITTVTDSLAVASQVVEPLPSGSSTTGPLVQSQAEEVDSTTQEGPSAPDVGGPAASSSNHRSGSTTAVAHQHQPHRGIPRRDHSGSDPPPLSPPRGAQPLPFQTPSASPTPPVASTSAAPVPIPSALAGMHPYYAQFKAPTPQFTAPPSIHFFTPFVPPGSSAPGSALAPSVPSWPPTVPPPLPQPGPSGPVISSYSTLAGAVTQPQNANHPAPTLPIPVIGTFNAESHVVVQVKQRQGPQKCSKCLQLGCKGANGVQHCPNPCAGCKQVDCEKPHTLGGNLCLEE